MNPNVTTKPGGTAVQERKAVSIFGEKRPEPRTSAECHRLGDEMAAEHPELVPNYTSRVKVAALPHHLMGMFNHELGKIPADQSNRIGVAMRRAAAAAPRDWLPRYSR